MLNINSEMALRKLACMWGDSRLLFFAECGKFISLSIVPDCSRSIVVDSAGEEVRYWPGGGPEMQHYPHNECCILLSIAGLLHTP